MREQEETRKAATDIATTIPPVERTSADLVLERRDEDRWEVTAATPRARRGRETISAARSGNPSLAPCVSTS
ncbi:hypothetical protein U8P71_25915 (plasmid) [Rhizobium ruizarguesonis]|nr:hypothetical protein U8P71_25915 [Rhizobium ruizarguesonis]